MTTISLTGWDTFQHYKDRDPPWIKLYRDILTTESWVLGTDVSRLVQVASMLLAVRYKNQIPLNWPLLKKVASLDCSEKQFLEALAHLEASNFLTLTKQEVTSEPEGVAQPASTALATCNSETEQRQSRGDQSRDRVVPQERYDGPVTRIFAHWREVHDHARAALDGKRHKLIRAALDRHSEADLCQAISGYKNSPHHMGQNDRATVYDDIEVMIRDSKHVEAGLKFYAQPPRTDLSATTRRNIAATADWQPPELRNGN